MSDSAAFHAQIIESSVRVIGATAAECLLEKHPDVKAFGVPPFAGWHEHLVGRLYELAGAMLAGEPELFGHRTEWARVAFAAHGLDVGELLASMDAIESALAEQLPPGGAEAAAPYIAAGRTGLTREPDALPPFIGGPHNEICSRYMLALLEGDRRAAIGQVTDAVDADQLSAADAMMHVLVPVSREIGRMWHLGEIVVGEEHFMTTSATLLLGALRERLPMQSANGRAVLVGSVPGNRHDLAGRIAGLMLESAGWRVIDLGAETPSQDLVRAVQDFRADVLLLGAMLTTHVEPARKTIALLRASEHTANAVVIVGGHVFDEAPDLWKKIDADAHARTIEDVVLLADTARRRD
ncbi:MAG: B12-binding domain-containing protein [Phycisphaerales bacterium]